MNILEFPCNLLVEIFSYIDKWTLLASVRKVCQSFHRLSFDRSLWKTVSMNQFPRTVFTSKSFHELLSEAKNTVQCLHLDMGNLDDISMLHECITCSNLRELYMYAPLDDMEASNDHFEWFSDLEYRIEENLLEHIVSLKKYLSSFGERYPNLKALHLQSKGLDVGYLSDKFLDLVTFSISEGYFQDSCRYFFENHRSIKHMSLKKCIIAPSALLIVLSQLPQLETLDFSGSFQDCNYDWDNRAYIVKFDQLCRLRELCVDGNNSHFLSQICNKMPELRKLSIRDVLFKDKELIKIAKHSPKLETILILDSRCVTPEFRTTNEALFAIAASCTNLQVLHVDFCTNVDNIGIQRIIESCPNIHELEVEQCTSLTDDDMVSLVENCPRLQKLNLRGCTGLTSKSISAILIGCKSLKDLNLQYCYQLVDIRITDKSSPKRISTCEYSENKTNETAKNETKQIEVDEEINNCKKTTKAHSHIRKLNLKYCGNLSDKCLQQISSFCPDLREVRFECCSSISNQGVSTLLQNCTLLEKLYLTSSTMSTWSMDNQNDLADQCLSDIAKYCKNLRVLFIELNTYITPNGIFNVIQNCPRIEYIESSQRAGLFFDMDELKTLVGTVTGKVVQIEKPFSFRNPNTLYCIYIYKDYGNGR